MRFDGSAILRKILDHPDVFPIANNVDDIARKVVVARMKTTAGVSDLKIICAILGHDNFKMVADSISDAEAKSIVGKVDKDNKEAKTAGGPAQRVLLVELATGTIEPRAKVVKERAAKRPAKVSSSSAGKAIKSESTKASRLEPS